MERSGQGAVVRASVDCGASRRIVRHRGRRYDRSTRQHGEQGTCMREIIDEANNRNNRFFWKACYNHQSRKTASRTRH
jgi:hypothetical protein